MKRALVDLLVLILAAIFGDGLEAAESKTLWQGAIHLGDSPDQYSNVLTVGIAMQIPCQLDFQKPGKLTITTRDVQTLAGEGHFVELVAHYEDGDAPAREYVVETFRIKGDSTNVDIEHPIAFDPAKGLQGTPPAYYSLRIKIDTTVRFSLWDDFIVKRIEVAQ